MLHRDADEGQIEEEARLFYVAMTRAKDRLTLTHGRNLARDGAVEHPGRFFTELWRRAAAGDISGIDLLPGVHCAEPSRGSSFGN